MNTKSEKLTKWWNPVFRTAWLINWILTSGTYFVNSTSLIGADKDKGKFGSLTIPDSYRCMSTGWLIPKHHGVPRTLMSKVFRQDKNTKQNAICTFVILNSLISDALKQENFNQSTTLWQTKKCDSLWKLWSMTSTVVKITSKVNMQPNLWLKQETK